MDLASVELVEDLHEDEGIEDNGVVLRGRGMKRGVPPAVNVKHLLACVEGRQSITASVLRLGIPENQGWDDKMRWTDQ